MDKHIQSLLRNIHEKDVRELVEDHIRKIDFDEIKKEVSIFVDKRYAMNLLQSSGYISPFIGGVKSSFGQDVSVILRLDHPHHWHEREMLIPHTVHYG